MNYVTDMTNGKEPIEGEEVEITILRLGSPITVRTDKGKKVATFVQGTECAVLWQERVGKIQFFDCLLDTNLPIQKIGFHRDHQITREIRKVDEQLKLLVDKPQ